MQPQSPQQPIAQPPAQPMPVTSPQTAQAASQGQPYMQTSVTYIDGFWTTAQANRHPALLEWGAGERIRLHVQNYQGQASVTLFDCAPQDVKSFSTGAGMGTLKLRNGQTYPLEFSSQARVAALESGVSNQFGPLGMVVGTKIEKNAIGIDEASGIEWWTQNLSKYGVGGLQMSARKMYGVSKASWWILGVLGGLFLLFVLFALVMYLASS